MAVCTNCGAGLPDEARFCPNCGQPVFPAAQRETQPAGVPEAERQQAREEMKAEETAPAPQAEKLRAQAQTETDSQQENNAPQAQQGYYAQSQAPQGYYAPPQARQGYYAQQSAGQQQAPQGYYAPPQARQGYYAQQAPQGNNTPPHQGPQGYYAQPQNTPPQNYYAQQQAGQQQMPQGYYTQQQPPPPQNYYGQQNNYGYQQNRPEQSYQTYPGDIEENKGICVLCYLWLLLLVPLLTKPNSGFVKYHSNQGLVLLIFEVIVGILSWIPYVGTYVIGPIGGLFGLVCVIIGIMNAVNGQMKPLPLIGKFILLK